VVRRCRLPRSRGRACLHALAAAPEATAPRPGRPWDCPLLGFAEGEARAARPAAAPAAY
jgi:hypothetical protein